MNDKELADKVVAVGVGGHSPPYPWVKYAIKPGTFSMSAWLEAEEFVRDWRVAGALMERCQATFVEALTDEKWSVRADWRYGHRTREWYSNESLPRAIIEACVEALEAK